MEIMIERRGEFVRKKGVGVIVGITGLSLQKWIFARYECIALCGYVERERGEERRLSLLLLLTGNINSFLLYESPTMSQIPSSSTT